MKSLAPCLWIGCMAAAWSCARSPAEPPAPPAPTQATVQSADGVDIQFEVSGGGQPAVVFIHCWCCDRAFFEQQIPVLAKRFQTVALDLGGHGQSGTARERWTIDAFARDVEAVVSHLGLEQVVLVGHSMGGPVGVAAALRMPERVRGLVAIDTLHDVEHKPTEEETAGWRAAFADGFAEAMRKSVKTYLFKEDSDPAVIDWVTERAVRCDERVGMGAIQGMLAFDLQAAVAKLQIPVRAINTDLNSTNLEANRRHVRDYEVVIMEGLGHYPQLEAPKAFNEHLEQILGQM